MTDRFSIRIVFMTLPLALGGCGMFDWATNNMPVIGERCENWQCFTSGGQAQSKAVEEQRLHPAGNPLTSPGTPIPGAANSSAASPLKPASPMAAPAPASAAVTPVPAAPEAEPMPEGGAYKYVPRAPAAAGTTPFDGAITPIQ